ncbi:MAG: hypothetical protein L0271_16620 [Gemmatimonadetes bacterium]|nr:hypothetical protein [Gemmatimonadota bacterium]
MPISDNASRLARRPGRSQAVTTLVMAVALAAAAPIAAQRALPTPESVLGFRPGDDFKLATYEESIGYFRALDAASDRVTLVDVGVTSEGRPWTIAFISSPANLARLEQIRMTAQRLAHPAGLDDTQALRIAREGVPIVDISGGLHASEVAGAQHTIQLAYDLVATRGDPRLDAILDRVVLMLWPSLNPDGQDIVVEWYRGNVGGPYETAPLVELYQKYVGHDNNRDAYMLNVTESRVITRAWRHWEPQIIHVHHQSSPFPTRIWLPPFAEPIAARAPALISREINVIGMLMAQRLESRGQTGAVHMGTGFDAWYPGYIDYMPVFQNIAAYWTETALYRYATPRLYTLDDFPRNMRDLRTGSLYASPWTGGWWRLRDAVEYMLTASIAVLDYAAKYREDVLYNRYQSGRDQIRRYTDSPPYAYIVPQDQRDPMAAAELLRRLAFHGIRISQLQYDAELDGTTYARGTWVIPMQQEFAELTRQLFDAQVYPDLREYPDGPPELPYDAAGWTLPMQMDVRVIAAREPLPASFVSALRPLGEQVADGVVANSMSAWEPDAPFSGHGVAVAIAPPPGTLTGAGSRIAVDPAHNETFRLIARTLGAGGRVQFGDGRYLLDGGDPTLLERWIEERGVRAARTSSEGTPVHARIAVYQSWRASMDEGWTRWLLDYYEMPYTRVTDADVRAGALRDRFDVIVLASDGAQAIVEGHAEGSVPPEYAGGIGEAGVRAIDAFVRDGGTLVCLNASTEFAIQHLHLPVRNSVAGLDRGSFFASGSILEVMMDPTHPVTAGMPDRAKIFFDRSPAFEPTDGFRGRVLARYAEAGSPLLSGYLLGEDRLHGRAALVDAEHGDGHVILIGFRPQWRGQPWGSFRILLNASLYGADLTAR